MIYSDRNLAKRLERTEARSNIDFVKARAEMFPSSGANGNALFNQICVQSQIDYSFQPRHTN